MAKVNATKTKTETKTENASVFADGLIVFKPHEKAPDFVKATLKIDINKLSQWCVDNEDKLTDYKGQAQLNLTIKESKDGKLYASVDLYGTEFSKSESDSDELPF